MKRLISYLLLSVLGFAGGAFVVKVFQGEGFDEYVREMRVHFEKVTVRKPKASRDRSAEVYMLGKGLKPSAK